MIHVIISLLLGLLLLAVAWVGTRWRVCVTCALIGAGALLHALNVAVVMFVS